jgi:hypothetical protein
MHAREQREGNGDMTTSHETPGAGDGAERTPVQARQAVTTGHMRWVLRISLALGVLALAGALLGYVTMQHRPGHGDTVSPPAASQAAHESGAS